MTHSIFESITSGLSKDEFLNLINKNELARKEIREEFDNTFGMVRVGRENVETCLIPTNHPKCRYLDILCLDKSRVILPSQTFIHANWVDGLTTQRKYILAQGPTKNTMVDFLEMVYNYKAPIIVMITKLMEGDKEKCVQYWPIKETMQVGPYQLEMKTQKSEPKSIVITKFTITDTKNYRKTRTVQHVQFLNWPDHSVPDNSTEFNALIKQVNELNSTENNKNHPIIVHCSAGIGRSGTYLMISMSRELYDSQKIINIQQMLGLLRRQRLHAVQNHQQYVFIYEALADYVSQK